MTSVSGRNDCTAQCTNILGEKQGFSFVEVTPKFHTQISQSLLHSGIQGIQNWKSTFFEEWGNLL
jgi:hypothetical protein